MGAVGTWGGRHQTAHGETVPAFVAPSLEEACRRWPQRVALTAGDRHVTYGELWSRVVALGNAYRRLGVRAGDRVLCGLRDCPEHVIAVHGAWACGAVHVGVSADLTGAELAALTRRLEPSAVVLPGDAGDGTPGRLLREVQAASPGIVGIVDGEGAGEGQHTLARLLGEGGDDLTPPARHGPGDPAVVFLTSGTTGRPKAVVETLPALWAKLAFFADAYGPGPDDVHLMYLPMNHAFGLKLSLLALLSGGRLVLLERFAPKEALRLVTEEGVSVLPGTPTHLTLVLDGLDPDRHRIDSLRWVVSAAAGLPSWLIERIYDTLGAQVLFVYGCSEGFLTVTTDRREIAAGAVGHTVFRGPAGTPAAGTVAIADPEDGHPVGAGQVGEIVYGAAAPVRYWDEPDAAVGGWYRTGDLGRLDADGRLFVLGRLKELVNRGGLKVSPVEIEVALALHPGVGDVAVLGTPDRVLGEAICACLVPAGPTTPAPTLGEVRAFLATSLARHKLPDELCLVEGIPRSPIGKLDRGALRALVIDEDVPRERLRPG